RPSHRAGRALSRRHRRRAGVRSDRGDARPVQRDAAAGVTVDLETLGPASTDPALRIPRLIERRDGDVLPRTPGVDELTIADIDPVVAQAVKEHQVTRLQPIS